MRQNERIDTTMKNTDTTDVTCKTLCLFVHLFLYDKSRIRKVINDGQKNYKIYVMSQRDDETGNGQRR